MAPCWRGPFAKALDEGLVPALQILHMRFFGDRSGKVPINPSLIELGREMLRDTRIYTHDSRQQNHGITKIAEVVFGACSDPELARSIWIAMRDNVRNNYVSDREFSALAALIREWYPLIVYEEIIDKSTNEHLIERSSASLRTTTTTGCLTPNQELQRFSNGLRKARSHGRSR
jgi:hypothetical protein